MAFGLQVFGPDGALYFDLSKSLGRFHGQLTTNGAASSAVLPSLTQGTPFIMVRAAFNLFDPYTPPTFTLSGTTLSWTSGAVCTVYYGTY